jgi:hypothetical protein
MDKEYYPDGVKYSGKYLFSQATDSRRALGVIYMS